jgi:hypothetical protein
MASRCSRPLAHCHGVARCAVLAQANAGRGGRHPDAGGASSGQEGDRAGGWQNGKRLRQDSDLSEPSDSEQQHKHPRHSDRNNQSSRPQPAANGGSAAAAANGNDSGTDDVAVVNDQSPPPSPPSLQLEAELATLLQTDARDLLKQGKLCLVLDLDHTLLNSARFSELSSSTELSLQNRLAHETQSIPAGQRELYRLPKVGMWTKLRPGVREFLQRASEKFELWIHTNGNRCVERAACRAPQLGPLPLLPSLFSVPPPVFRPPPCDGSACCICCAWVLQVATTTPPAHCALGAKSKPCPFLLPYCVACCTACAI